MAQGNEGFIQLALSMIIIPWVLWVSVSIFNQRQEIALLKQILASLEKRVN